MINLVCKNCGWRMPLMKKRVGKALSLVNVDVYDTICPSCGHVMITLKNGFKEYTYRKRMGGYRKRSKCVKMKVVRS